MDATNNRFYREEAEPPMRLQDPTERVQGFADALVGTIKDQQRRIEVAERDKETLRAEVDQQRDRGDQLCDKLTDIAYAWRAACDPKVGGTVESVAVWAKFTDLMTNIVADFGAD